MVSEKSSKTKEKQNSTEPNASNRLWLGPVNGFSFSSIKLVINSLAPKPCVSAPFSRSFSEIKRPKKSRKSEGTTLHYMKQDGNSDVWDYKILTTRRYERTEKEEREYPKTPFATVESWKRESAVQRGMVVFQQAVEKANGIVLGFHVGAECLYMRRTRGPERWFCVTRPTVWRAGLETAA